MKSFQIDFDLIDGELLTGRKNGARAKEFFKVKHADLYVFKANEAKLITSSYFLGLMEEFLVDFGSPDEVLRHVDLNGVPKLTRDECEKAIRRGLIKNKGII